MIENLTSNTIFIAKDKQNKTFINQSFSDRLFHTFILGVTGSGKINQTVIPMIKQDLDNSIKKHCSIILLDPTSYIESEIYNYAQKEGKPIIRFNPHYTDCLYYNPLAVDEQSCISNFTNMFLKLNPNCSVLETNATLILIEYSIKVIKRLYKDEANLKILEKLLDCYSDESKKIIDKYLKTNTTAEDNNIGNWFNNEYFKEIGLEHDKYSTFDRIISSLNSDKYLGRILNPQICSNTISFEELVLNNCSVIINTAHGLLKDGGKILSSLIMSEIQTAIFKRDIEKNTIPLFLYIHESQEFINKDFTKLITCGKSYNVSCTISLQTLDRLNICMTKSEKDILMANVRNTILYPNASDNDIKYFKPLFENIIDKLDPNESTISKLEFSEHNLKYRVFPEFICSLILNSRYTLPKICTPIEYDFI